jgi:alanine racemase
MAVVKADGYGHGAVLTARTAIEAGAERLGVATVGEAAVLRAAEVSVPILILGPIDPSEIDEAIGANVDLTVGSRHLAEAIQGRSEAFGRMVRVHVKIDSGMHRYGSNADTAAEVVSAILASSGLRLAGICTHLATADDPAEPATERQLKLFNDVVRTLRSNLPPGIAFHASNSAASIRRLFPEGAFDRIGIALYGLRPSPKVELLPGMRPALSVVSRLARVHSAGRDEAVSYGRTYALDEDERLGLVPIGYADGYRRGLSNLAWACVGEAKCRVRGRICMDQTIVGCLPADALEGDLVGLLGPLLDGPSADELGELCGTINYEIVAGLSQRVPRYYVRSDRVVAIMTGGKLAE